MKRLAKILLLLTILLIVALPGAVGMIAERQHDRLAMQLPGDQLSKESYERGWFSSQSRYRYRIDDERLTELAATITRETGDGHALVVDSKLYHGPVPALAGGRAAIAWTDAESSLALLAPSGQEVPLPGALRSRVEADGSSVFVYTAEPESRQLGNELTLRWEEMRVYAEVGRNATMLEVDGEIGQITLEDNDTGIVFGPASIRADQVQSRNKLWTGDSALQIDAVRLPEFETGTITFDTRIREVDDTASYAVELRLRDVRGPGLDGDDLHIDLYMERIDAAALSEVIELAESYPGNGPVLMADRDALFARLLRPGPALRLRTLKIPTPDADIEGTAFVTVEPGTGTALSDLGRGVAGETTLYLPQAIVHDAESGGPPEVREAIALMRRFRILVPDGNRYRIEADYAGGLLTVNGFPVPVPVF